MLTIADIKVSFGGFRALGGVSMTAAPGSIVGIVGPNGSGKSTLINVVSGIQLPDSGTVRLDDRLVPLGRPDLIAAYGIGRSFQVSRLARRLTVLQNMMVSARGNAGERLFDLFLRPVAVAAGEQRIQTRAMEILRRLDLAHKANDYAGGLSGGQQKLLSLGMVLMSDPRVLLLDEPAAGVNPVLIEQRSRLPEIAAGGRPDHPADRAQYGNDRRPLRPGLCARCRRGHRRRHARGDPARRAGHALLSGSAGMSGPAFLELADVSAGYGAITVLDGLSLRLAPAEILAVLGANGSGKSTVLKTIIGLTRMTAGRIALAGTDITRAPAHKRAALGIGYVPQNQNVFADLTVTDNLRMGGYLRPRSLGAEMDEVFDLFPRLKERRRELAGNLSGGERRMLSIGLTLLLKPKLLLLDEPSSDLAPAMVDLVFAAIGEIHRRLSLPILLVEQNVEKALAIAERVVVLVRGTQALDVPAGEVDRRHLHALFLDGGVRTRSA